MSPMPKMAKDGIAQSVTTRQKARAFLPRLMRRLLRLGRRRGLLASALLFLPFLVPADRFIRILVHSFEDLLRFVPLPLFRFPVDLADTGDENGHRREHKQKPEPAEHVPMEPTDKTHFSPLLSCWSYAGSARS